MSPTLRMISLALIIADLAFCVIIGLKKKKMSIVPKITLLQAKKLPQFYCS